MGRSEAAYGEAWRVPTSKEPMAGEEFVRLACELAGRPYKLQVEPAWMLALMSVFIPLLRANREMVYQFEHDYRFDSTKIEVHYGSVPTPYREGIAAALQRS